MTRGSLGIFRPCKNRPQVHSLDFFATAHSYKPEVAVFTVGKPGTRASNCLIDFIRPTNFRRLANPDQLPQLFDAPNSDSAFLADIDLRGFTGDDNREQARANA